MPHPRATTEANSISIIYIGTGAAHFGLPLMGAYSATKAAMNLFMESLMYEKEGVDHPIEVKVVCPQGGSTRPTSTRKRRSSLACFIEKTMQNFGAMQGPEHVGSRSRRNGVDGGDGQ